ncbi:MFS transporter [Leekyejoonella antrihumi]|uniref:MFS transporter n=1 Tax=Leekyejoonella antrihumi TaxID=1660198 RepID=A0A563E812_9MICO|nr:MFS transporter [Leekyejoonella antrihumi]TWP37964.1 MFS transporter [Leekyejoonella antrihumi]
MSSSSTHRRPAVGRPDDAAPVEKGRLFGLTWAHLLNDGASNYLPGVLPAVLTSLDQPVRMAGAFVAAMTIGQALQPVTGWLADRLGGRSLVVLGLLLSSVAGGLLGVAQSTWMLVILLLLIGIGSGFFHPQALAGVRSLLRGRQGLLTSVFLVGGEAGRGIWPTAASLVVSHFGLHALWVVGVPGVLTAPFLLRAAPRLPAISRQTSRILWRKHARPLTVLVSYRSIQALATYALVTFIPITWHLRGGHLDSGASIITTMLLVGILGNVGGGHLADRLGRTPVLLGSALATAALIILIAYASGAWLWVVAGLAGIAIFGSASTCVLIGQDIFPENRSMGSGIALGLGNGIGALLVLVIGLLVSDTDIVRVYWVLGALSAASAVLVLALPGDLMHRPALQ